MPLNNILGGVAGEYLVAGELSKQGYIASITLRNTRGVDILCSDEDAKKTIGIQVKTNKGSSRHWILNEKCEKYFASNLFYIFVNLNANEKPAEFFIVPSKVVADYTTKSHQKWLRTPGAHGQRRNDSSVRKFFDEEEKYLNKWKLLGL
ncbi:MAG: aspartate ammonia-lyase [Atribacterota bacterium]|nr:aspartate ammonia-lyase [Atribacterota bacterium]